MNIFKKKEKKDPKEDQLIDVGMTAQSYQDLQNAKKTYQLAIGSLSVTVLILTMMVSTKNTEVVVMPPDYYEPVVLNGNYANQAYAAGHAMMVANLMGNVNDRNIEFVTNVVMRMLSPHLYAELQQAFQTETQLLKNRRARQSFFIEDVMFDAKNNIVFVWGTKRTSLLGQSEISERFTYEFQIQPKNGIPKITYFNAYTGVPNVRDPKRVVEIKPYLTRDLKLASLMATTDVTYAKPDEQAGGAPEQKQPETPTNEQQAQQPEVKPEENQQEQN